MKTLKILKRCKCRLCNSEKVNAVINLPLVYVADKYGKIPFEKSVKYPIDIYQCESCGHVQILDILPLEHLFSSEYTYKPSRNPQLVKHFEYYASNVKKNLGYTPKKSLDIGSNDGLFLECLRNKYSTEVLGIDPADSAVKAANEKEITTIKAFFTESLADELNQKGQEFDHISANNVFAHNDDLVSFTKGVSKLLKKRGLFTFEISYLIDIVEKGLIGTIFHEHLSHHSLLPLIKFLESHDLNLFDVDYVDTQGGALIGYASKGKNPNYSNNLNLFLNREKDLHVDKGLYMTKFRNILLNIKNQFNELLYKNLRDDSRLIAFGAARSANLLIEFFQLNNSLDFILDDNQEKIGQFLFNTNTEIISAKGFNSTDNDIFIPLAWIHSKNIENRLKNEGFKGKYLKFYPNVEITEL